MWRPVAPPATFRKCPRFPTAIDRKVFSARSFVWPPGPDTGRFQEQVAGFWIALWRGAKTECPTMPRKRRRLNDKSDQPYWKAPLFNTIQTKVGQELRALYEPPQELPHQMLTLLMQVNEQLP